MVKGRPFQTRTSVIARKGMLSGPSTQEASVRKRISVLISPKKAQDQVDRAAFWLENPVPDAGCHHRGNKPGNQHQGAHRAASS